MLGQRLLVGVVLTIGMVIKGCRTVVFCNAWDFEVDKIEVVLSFEEFKTPQIETRIIWVA